MMASETSHIEAKAKKTHSVATSTTLDKKMHELNKMGHAFGSLSKSLQCPAARTKLPATNVAIAKEKKTRSAVIHGGRQALPTSFGGSNGFAGMD